MPQTQVKLGMAACVCNVQSFSREMGGLTCAAVNNKICSNQGHTGTHIQMHTGTHTQSVDHEKISPFP